MNLPTIDEVEERHPNLDFVLLESCDDKPFVFANLKEKVGVEEIIHFIEHEGMLQRPAA